MVKDCVGFESWYVPKTSKDLERIAADNTRAFRSFVRVSSSKALSRNPASIELSVSVVRAQSPFTPAVRMTSPHLAISSR